MSTSAPHAAAGVRSETPMRSSAASPVEMGQTLAGQRTRAARRARRAARGGRGGPTSSCSVQRKERPASSLRSRPAYAYLWAEGGGAGVVGEEALRARPGRRSDAVGKGGRQAQGEGSGEGRTGRG